MVKEAQSKIDAIAGKTMQLLQDFIKKQSEEIAKTKSQKHSLKSIKGLPQKRCNWQP